jgi:ATPase subunit of ABC transporter with duplicated ATPase domains
MMDGDVGKLSGGWKMRVALARILLMRPDALLLDEPSNHLDLESLIWLEAFLKGYDGALLMTSHDREFMNRIVNKVVEIDGGSLTAYSGNYEFYQQQRALADKQQQAQFERQQAMLAKEIAFIERFKARASHAAQVQSRVKKLDKIDRSSRPSAARPCRSSSSRRRARARTWSRSRTCTKAYGSRTIYEGLDFQVRRKERWCIMGINGAGKSTLLKLVPAPRSRYGTVARGPSVKMGYFAQHAMEVLDGERTVFQRWKTRSRRPARRRCARSPAASAFPATRSRSAAACCRAARRRGSSWRSCCSIRPTFWCSTSRPTTLISPPRKC